MRVRTPTPRPDRPLLTALLVLDVRVGGFAGLLHRTGVLRHVGALAAVVVAAWTARSLCRGIGGRRRRLDRFGLTLRSRVALLLRLVGIGADLRFRWLG